MTRKINKGTLRTWGGQVIACEDNIAIIAKTRKIMENILNKIEEQGKIIRLELNQKKNQYHEIR